MPNSTTEPNDRVRCKRAMSDYSEFIRFMAEPSSAQVTGVALLFWVQRSSRCVVCQGLVASKPAPTFDLCRSQIACPLKIPCGSGLARESVSPIDTESGSVRRNQQLPQSRSMLNNLPGQLQPLIVQVAIILPSRRQLIQVQFNRKLSLLPPGLEQQRAQRIHQRAAAGKQQAAITRFHPVDHQRKRLVFLGASHDRGTVSRAVRVHVA